MGTQPMPPQRPIDSAILAAPLLHLQSRQGRPKSVESSGRQRQIVYAEIPVVCQGSQTDRVVQAVSTLPV